MADDWHWSEWITPGLVPAKANLAQANAGASVSIGGSSDPNAAVDAVRTGGATGGSSLGPFGTGPYTYSSTGEVDADPFSSGFSAVAYDRSGAILTTPPESFAAFNVGYASGYWRERPELRRLPLEFLALSPSEYVPIDPTDPTWAGLVEFEPGVDSVAVEWADIWLSVGGPDAGGGNEVEGHIGYAPSILLPAAVGWTGVFGSWPPPLGSHILDLPGPDAPTDQLLPVKPAAGSDFTVVSYTDMALAAYSPNDEWQQWSVRPHGGSLGQALYIWHQMPRFRYRVPGAGLEPRFFVVYEGEDRAVGFGKPDTELAVFGVQTALGNYRDMTFAEYAAAGDPLPDFTP